MFRLRSGVLLRAASLWVLCLYDPSTTWTYTQAVELFATYFSNLEHRVHVSCTTAVVPHAETVLVSRATFYSNDGKALRSQTGWLCTVCVRCLRSTALASLSNHP